jgi:hypothetical protein
MSTDNPSDNATFFGKRFDRFFSVFNWFTGVDNPVLKFFGFIFGTFFGVLASIMEDVARIVLNAPIVGPILTGLFKQLTNSNLPFQRNVLLRVAPSALEDSPTAIEESESLLAENDSDEEEIDFKKVYKENHLLINFRAGINSIDEKVRAINIDGVSSASDKFIKYIAAPVGKLVLRLGDAIVAGLGSPTFWKAYIKIGILASLSIVAIPAAAALFAEGILPGAFAYLASKLGLAAGAASIIQPVALGLATFLAAVGFSAGGEQVSKFWSRRNGDASERAEYDVPPEDDEEDEEDEEKVVDGPQTGPQTGSQFDPLMATTPTPASAPPPPPTHEDDKESKERIPQRLSGDGEEPHQPQTEGEADESQVFEAGREGSTPFAGSGGAPQAFLGPRKPAGPPPPPAAATDTDQSAAPPSPKLGAGSHS